MRIPLSLAALLAASALLSVSCTVKEDRSRCKCFTDIVFSPESVSAYEGRNASVSINDGSLQRFDIPVSGEPKLVQLSRTGVALWCHLPDAVRLGSVTNDEYRLADGSPCDSLVAGSESFSAEGRETLTQTVSLHKRYAAFSVVFEDGVYEGWTPVLEYSVSGTSLRDLSPLPGAHTETLLRVGDIARSVLPCCGPDATMTLSLVPSDPTVPAFTVDVQDVLRGAGYDWSQADLDDIRLVLGSGTAEFSVVPAEWEDGGGLEF